MATLLVRRPPTISITVNKRFRKNAVLIWVVGEEGL
jgi:hypothetical protein